MLTLDHQSPPVLLVRDFQENLRTNYDDFLKASEGRMGSEMAYLEPLNPTRAKAS